MSPTEDVRKTENSSPELNSHVDQWRKLQEKIHASIGETAFKSWIAPLTFHGIEGKSLVIGTPTRFMRDWVQSHYADLFVSQWNQDIIPVQTVDIIVVPQNADFRPALNKNNNQDDSQKTQNQSRQEKAQKPADDFIVNQNVTLIEGGITASRVESLSSPLDPRFTFENFIVGKPNELAYAAARRITESVNVSFNPFYLYGGVGIGKTHLMHAIAWEIKKRSPERTVLYLSAEKFMYQFIRALRFKDTVMFKELFRSVDILLIDDIQFISGKDSTQEEFFHTFNALLDQNRQVVISADKNPSDLHGIDDRLRSRMGWGLVADINSSNFELRLGILQAKCRQFKAQVPLKVLEFLAHKITSNIRELEGALNRILAHSELVGRPITLESTQDILRDLLRSNTRRITIDEIQRKVAEHFNLRLTDMHSARRARTVARPRQIAMYLCKQLTTRSLPEIGRKFGGRDHTTVMHAVRKIDELCLIDSVLAEDVELLRKAFTE